MKTKNLPYALNTDIERHQSAGVVAVICLIGAALMVAYYLACTSG